MLKKIIATCLLVTCTFAQAQDEVLEEVIVTGIMETDGYYEMPAVTLKKQGDFLVQDVKMINDSRDKSLREKEMHKWRSNPLARKIIQFSPQ